MKDDSLLIHDDVMFVHKSFVKAIKSEVSNYEPYNEANEWLEQVFFEVDCFTFLGL